MVVGCLHAQLKFFQVTLAVDSTNADCGVHVTDLGPHIRCCTLGRPCVVGPRVNATLSVDMLSGTMCLDAMGEGTSLSRQYCMVVQMMKFAWAGNLARRLVVLSSKTVLSCCGVAMQAGSESMRSLEIPINDALQTVQHLREQDAEREVRQLCSVLACQLWMVELTARWHEATSFPHSASLG
jgi:hypothetical protein